MDFFANQDRAKRTSWWLIFSLLLSVSLIVVSVYVLVVLVLSNLQPKVKWSRPELALLISGVTSLLIAGGSIFKYFEILAGGEHIARSLGGTRIQPNTTDLSEKRLLNVVEEMAIASGIAVPPVYVLKNEPSINAFAAGFSPSDAVIGVNQGTLDTLNREELQGVIAHEFSHILNGDMRINLKLIALLHGILLLALIGQFVFRISASAGSSNDKESKGGQLVILAVGLVLWLIGSIGFFCARLIKAALSRQREYLADASAVQFTRHPEGIGNALKKIGGWSYHSRMKSPNAEEASHMFFANGLYFAPLLSTHPPLVDRIKRILPNFDGSFPERISSSDPASFTSSDMQVTSGFADQARHGSQRVEMNTPEVMASVGTLETKDVAHAATLMHAIPPKLEAYAREPFSAQAVFLALLLSEDTTVSKQQLQLIEKDLGAAISKECQRSKALLKEMVTEVRLPLIEIIQSTLGHLSKPQYLTLRSCTQRLIEVDGKLSLLEFVLQSTVIKHLDRRILDPAPADEKYSRIDEIAPELQVLLSALAYAGEVYGDAANRAYNIGASLAFGMKSNVPMLARSECGFQQWAGSLMRLGKASLPLKNRIMRAAIETVSVDGQATVLEAEILRTIAEHFDCPIPPIMPGKLKKNSLGEVVR